ncbi:MAG TPA: serine hydrolase [Tepidisphaeraceae bacterium]|jgi:CubicO group peptidase (beta-lactamase class C family)
MRIHRTLIAAALIFCSWTSITADPLPRATPESQGVSSAAIRNFVESANQKINTLHSFMLLRHGQVVAEGWWKPEAADKPHVLHSLSKSFTSTAVGLLIEDGKLSLDDPVLKFFPDDAPATPSDNLKAMRVRDLLTMTCGHDVEAKRTNDVPWTKIFLNHPVPHKPGTHFQYNSLGTYMLSAIVTKVTGQTVLDYLTPRLFQPLGIEKPHWDASPQGISCGGWGLYLHTEDVAKFGQLYLQKGKWNGKQIVPEKWVEQATKYQVPNKDAPSGRGNKPDWQQGYGYQFWQCQHHAYRGDGANGQFCIVMPEQDAVLAITANTGDMQNEINVVWDTLLPAFHDNPLPPNPSEESRLKQTLAGLQVPAPKDQPGAPTVTPRRN